MKFKDFIEEGKWKQPVGYDQAVLTPIVVLRGKSLSGGRVVDTNYWSSAVANSKDNEELKEARKENALRTLKDMIEHSIETSQFKCHKIQPHKDEDGNWVITPRQAHRQNKPLRIIAIKETEWDFVIPVQEIQLYDFAKKDYITHEQSIVPMVDQ